MSHLNLTIKGILYTLSLTTASLVMAETDANTTLPTTTLETIVVTASSGGITPSVNQQVVEKNAILDMKEVLQDQPSLSVSGGNGVAQQLYMRNFGENELSFSVDDVSTNSQIFHHQSRFMFDPVLLKSMEIQKGTGAASSGIGVTAGSIKMTTVNANDMLEPDDNVGAMLGGGYSSNDGYHAVAAAYGRDGDKRFDAIVIGSYKRYKDYEDGNNEIVPNTGMDQEGYLAKLGWNVSPDHRLELSQRREHFSGNLGFRPNLVGTFANQPVMDTAITQDTSNLTYQGYGLAGKVGVETKANVFYSQVSDERHQIDRISDRFPMNFDSYAKTMGANAEIAIPVLQRHELSTGINYRDSKIGSESFSVGVGEEQKSDYGIFAQMDWDFDPVSLSTGVRYDHYDITNTSGDKLTGDMVSPSIAAAWQATENLQLHASWSQAMQSPKLYEALILSLPWADRRSFAEGLKAGTAQTSEIGVKWRNDQGWMADAAVYEQRIKDYIAVEEAVQDNQGELKNQGYEINLGYRNKGLHAYIGLSDNEPKLNGEYFAYALDAIPTGTKYNAGLSYQFDRPNLEVGVKHHYVGDYNYQLNDSNGVLRDYNIPSYWVTDIFANWQPFDSDKLSINAGVNNLANKFYYNQSNFRSARFEDFTPWNAEKGREYRLGMNIKF